MNRAAATLISMASTLLPARHRRRRREEWLADAAGAPELGMSAWSVALGALRFALLAPWRHTVSDAFEADELALARARRGIACLAASLVARVAAVPGAAFMLDVRATVTQWQVAYAAVTVLEVLGIGSAVIGCWSLWLAARSPGTGSRMPMAGAALVVAGGSAAVVGALAAPSTARVVVSAGAMVVMAIGTLVELVSLAPVAGHSRPAHLPAAGVRARRWIGSISVAVIATITTLGIVNALVWTGQFLAQEPTGFPIWLRHFWTSPDVRVDTIQAFVWQAVPGLLATLAILWLTFGAGRRRSGREPVQLSTRDTAAAALLLTGATALASWIAAFSAAMTAADEYLVSGGVSPQGTLLVGVGALCIMAAAWLWGTGPRLRETAPTPFPTPQPPEQAPLQSAGQYPAA